MCSRLRASSQPCRKTCFCVRCSVVFVICACIRWRMLVTCAFIRCSWCCSGLLVRCALPGLLWIPEVLWHSLCYLVPCLSFFSPVVRLLVSRLFSVCPLVYRVLVRINLAPRKLTQFPPAVSLWGMQPVAATHSQWVCWMYVRRVRPGCLGV